MATDEHTFSHQCNFQHKNIVSVTLHRITWRSETTVNFQISIDLLLTVLSSILYFYFGNDHYDRNLFNDQAVLTC